jgi:hypothetical protein
MAIFILGLVLCTWALQEWTAMEERLHIFVEATRNFKPGFHFCRALMYSVHSKYVLSTQYAHEVCKYLKPIEDLFDNASSDEMITTYGREFSIEGLCSIPALKAVAGQFDASCERAIGCLEILKESKVLPRYLGCSYLRIALGYARVGMFSLAQQVFNDCETVVKSVPHRKTMKKYFSPEIFSILRLWFDGLATQGDPLLLVCQRTFSEDVLGAVVVDLDEVEVHDRTSLQDKIQKALLTANTILKYHDSVVATFNIVLVCIELCLIFGYYEDAERIAAQFSDLGTLGLGDVNNLPEFLTLQAVAKIGVNATLKGDEHDAHLETASELLKRSMRISMEQGAYFSILSLLTFSSSDVLLLFVRCYFVVRTGDHCAVLYIPWTRTPR